MRWLVGIFDEIVVPSPYLAAIFERHGFETTTIPNVADLTRFRFRVRAGASARLLVPRNLEPLYDVSTALRTFRAVQRQLPHAH